MAACWHNMHVPVRQSRLEEIAYNKAKKDGRVQRLEVGRTGLDGSIKSVYSVRLRSKGTNS